MVCLPTVLKPMFAIRRVDGHSADRIHDRSAPSNAVMVVMIVLAIDIVMSEGSPPPPQHPLLTGETKGAAVALDEQQHPEPFETPVFAFSNAVI
jgi:hypothetical protein